MSESNIELEAVEVLPSTSQIADVQKTAIFPLVSLPKIVLTRLDLKNLPVPVYTSSPSAKKPVKRLVSKKIKSVVPNPLPNKTLDNVKHGSRLRGKPKKDYKTLSEIGKSSFELTKTPTGKVRDVVKKEPKSKTKQEDNTVKGMLKKTMLQKKSKISIPPAKKIKLIPNKAASTTALPRKPKKEKISAVALKKEISSKLNDETFQMDTDDSEDEFLYDELIDELVKPPNKKVSTSEKTTNITLKPNVGNKPPTIVKGGIVKKSSLPPNLKSVASPTTLNSSKLTGTALNSKSKTSAVESTIKTPATAETPKASLPIKASPFPISIMSSPPKTVSKDQGKKGQKRSPKSVPVIEEEIPLNINTPTSPIIPAKNSQKPKSAASVSRPRGRPKIGPKQAIKSTPIPNLAADESDEYTEIETLENIDTEPSEIQPNVVNDSTINNEDIQVVTLQNKTIDSDTDRSRISTKTDVDPHLDLLRILTDDIEDAQSDSSLLKEVGSENFNKPNETTKLNIISTPGPPDNTDSHSSENPVDPDTYTISDSQEAEKSSGPQTDELKTVTNNEVISDITKNTRELTIKKPVKATPPVRTIYDLMSEVSLQYPSWNLHIIPETNAFCIAQVTKGRLGLPTLKKCIELDADTYSAKVYIHQYHIKRFDGVYDSEETILALIEEIHSIKA